jgi:hypothetical protein
LNRKINRKETFNCERERERVGGRGKTCREELLGGLNDDERDQSLGDDERETRASPERLRERQ